MGNFQALVLAALHYIIQTCLSLILQCHGAPSCVKTLAWHWSMLGSNSSWITLKKLSKNGNNIYLVLCLFLLWNNNWWCLCKTGGHHQMHKFLSLLQVHPLNILPRISILEPSRYNTNFWVWSSPPSLTTNSDPTANHNVSWVFKLGVQSEATWS